MHAEVDIERPRNLSHLRLRGLLADAAAHIQAWKDLPKARCEEKTDAQRRAVGEEMASRIDSLGQLCNVYDSAVYTPDGPDAPPSSDCADNLRRADVACQELLAATQPTGYSTWRAVLVAERRKLPGAENLREKLSDWALGPKGSRLPEWWLEFGLNCLQGWHDGRVPPDKIPQAAGFDAGGGWSPLILLPHELDDPYVLGQGGATESLKAAEVTARRYINDLPAAEQQDARARLGATLKDVRAAAKEFGQVRKLDCERAAADACAVILHYVLGTSLTTTANLLADKREASVLRRDMQTFVAHLTPRELRRHLRSLQTNRRRPGRAADVAEQEEPFCKTGTMLFEGIVLDVYEAAEDS